MEQWGLDRRIWIKPRHNFFFFLFSFLWIIKPRYWCNAKNLLPGFHHRGADWSSLYQPPWRIPTFSSSFSLIFLLFFLPAFYFFFFFFFRSLPFLFIWANDWGRSEQDVEREIERDEWEDAAPVGHGWRRRRHWESKILRFLDTRTRRNLFLSLDGRRDLSLDGRRDLTCRGCGMEMEKDEGEQPASKQPCRGKDGRMGFWFGWEKGFVKFVMPLTFQIVF